MDIHQKRLNYISKILTFLFAIFLANYVVTRLYFRIWRLGQSISASIRPFSDIFFWIFLPVLLPLLVLFVIQMMDHNFFAEQGYRKIKFYLLGWIIFVVMIILSGVGIGSSSLIISLVVSFSSIFIFKLYNSSLFEKGNDQNASI